MGNKGTGIGGKGTGIGSSNTFGAMKPPTQQQKQAGPAKPTMPWLKPPNASGRSTTSTRVLPSFNRTPSGNKPFVPAARNSGSRGAEAMALGGRGPKEEQPVAATGEKERAARDEEIHAAVITLVSVDGVVEGARPLSQVLRELDRSQFTLVMVDPHQEPPVCRVFSRKLLYERERAVKKQKKTVAKAAKPQVVRLNANIGDHDFEIKVRKVVEFLEKGRRVTVQIEERSRNARQNGRTEERAARIMKDIDGICSVVNPPGIEANVWSVALQGKARA
ncbi:hypothetical protein FBU59_003561 [Linderina macrospora]|uniref:Uncharacterized protein n=1 Tax=Linderina macrospora TaxID=4868 RepID=A0ACC1J806_9FUNG|nr:hypothetical protein FBU59_003561 [Linderina macrospora]